MSSEGAATGEPPSPPTPPPPAAVIPTRAAWWAVLGLLGGELLAAGAHICAYDPVALDEAKRLYQDQAGAGRIEFSADAYEALRGADALLIATEWKEFRSPDYDRLAGMLGKSLIFDGRNLYDPGLMQKLGFQYFAIGRGLTSPAA